MTKHKFPYKWTLKDAKFTKDKGLVFSCFACGGGSTMGYKLAGFDVIGCNEIDKRMMDCYVKNHNPKYFFLEPIQEFKNRADLPKELFNLDILDGSPPCSSFSVAGNREKDWGKKKRFKEGQQEQVLDTLFFDFIDLAKRIQPKIVVAENVKGLLLGNGLKYVKRILDSFDSAGYEVCYSLLNASVMGVPQRRERVFFFAIRKDLAEPFMCQKNFFERGVKLDIDVTEDIIPFKEIKDSKGGRIHNSLMKYYSCREIGDKGFGDIYKREEGKDSFFNHRFLYNDKVANTLTAKKVLVHFDKPVFTSDSEAIKMATFPQDYDFCKKDVHYICGMSVPPVMMAQIASKIYQQWLSKINK